MSLLSTFDFSKIIDPCRRIEQNTIFLGGLIVSFLVVSVVPVANAGQVVGEYEVENCYEDYEDTDFCSEHALNEYNDAIINSGINFNEEYILHFFTPDETGFQEVVAIRPVSSEVFLTNIEIKPTNTPEFSKHSDTFCFDGEIRGYRNSAEGEGFCYQLEESEFSEFGTGFTRVYK